MSAIRPDLPAFGQTPPAPADAAAREAQAAFFRTVLGRTEAPAAAPPIRPSVAPQVAEPGVATRSAAAAPDPDRPLRPGSLVDIRV